MPLWVRIWHRTPFLDRRARVYMWHHGYWAVPPTLDWAQNDAFSMSQPYGRSRVRTLMLRASRRSGWHFGIRWSPVIHVFVCLVAALGGALVRGWPGAVVMVVLGEATLAVVSLFAGRKLGGVL